MLNESTSFDNFFKSTDASDSTYWSDFIVVWGYSTIAILNTLDEQIN